MSRQPAAPVQIVKTGSDFDDGLRPEEGVALCLSGGGYRAMLFHLGALWRLNEVGYLRRLKRVSSVSGGSITAGVLGLKWNHLAFNPAGVASNFQTEVVGPIRTMAGITIDVGAVLGGIFTFGSIAAKVAKAYQQHLFGGATLQDLPPDPLRFVINATSVQSGVLFRFSRPYMADYRVGLVPNPTVPLATAVASSSAFPPFLSPLRLKVDPKAWAPPSDKESEDLHREPYLSEVVLTDGGVYDNLGLETAWKKFSTILTSDGGGAMGAEAKPKGDWVRHAVRVADVIDNQVRSLRKRQLIGSYEQHTREGTYWGIRSDIGSYPASDKLPCPPDKTRVLADIDTRLASLSPALQERLCNWGYAVCDAALRSWVDTSLTPPTSFPYPNSGVG